MEKSVKPVMKEALREKMAGEIALSEEPGKTIRKWREQFRVSQQDLARHLDVSPSVISDYEAGRRKSPGIVTVRKIVDALIGIDEITGGTIMKQYSLANASECVMAIREFPEDILESKFIMAIEGENLTPQVMTDRHLHGYTVIDSIKAITSLDSYDYLKIYGWSSQRALIFTGVKFGRSPMIAIRAHPLKPAMVVYHRPEKVDELAVKLAEIENIPLIRTNLDVNVLIERLGKL
jgi:putative transcriptional regulator